jgi:RNA 2',3'-cyclic 3'-phosphodiesterase
MATIRLFVAVSISEQSRNAVSNLVENFRSESPGVRWVKPENLHLTLKFLGDVEESRLSSLKNALDSSVSDLRLFQFDLTNLGCFPNIKRPRVLWVGIEDESNQLVRLHKNIEEQFFKVDFPKEKRRFQPHLTVARIKDSRNSNLFLSEFQSYNLGQFTVDVADVLLIKSDLRQSGAKYSCLHKAKIN